MTGSAMKKPERSRLAYYLDIWQRSIKNDGIEQDLGTATADYWPSGTSGFTIIQDLEYDADSYAASAMNTLIDDLPPNCHLAIYITYGLTSAVWKMRDFEASLERAYDLLEKGMPGKSLY